MEQNYSQMRALRWTKIVQDGMLLAIGGFGLCGIPEALILALRDTACAI